MIHVVFLWHMHQPYYKDLVTGEYRLPWTRLHALKDYYGMVKLLDEFPKVHQTFNLVPSLIAQIEDYAAGTAKDPFLEIASKPAAELAPAERRFALQYLFQANHTHMIGRYPRYRELFQQFRSTGENVDRALGYFRPQDLADLQVLSQIAWFDEFFLEDREVAALVRKERGYSREDQELALRKQREFLKQVLPAYAAAARRGGIEISTSPFYHPILPLLCDTDQGRVSSPGLPLPKQRFRHPEDAEEQLRRGLDLHQRVFGVRPQGVWPSEGSVSEEVIAIAHKLGVKWMATDEGVLGRAIGYFFNRDGEGRLQADGGDKLYTFYHYQKAPVVMHMLFRDHTLSDLIGFVYSGMPAADAANHLIHRIRDCAQAIGPKQRDVMVPIILDGENAWEYYPQSGREFLRRAYDAIQHDPGMEAVTVTEAITRQTSFPRLTSLVPGSWINANFNVWIGAPEDNRAWDYLSSARDFYARAAAGASEPERKLAFEEVLIAEGSDWNWWYGPEHHSANDRDFDELYRKHLSNIYQALGASPPDYLAQPIAAGVVRPYFTPQTAYIHPRIDGMVVRYFDWIGAAMYTADRRSSAMHGKQFLLDSVYAGLDDKFLYGRLDFIGAVPEGAFELVVNFERPPRESKEKGRELRLDVSVADRTITASRLTAGAQGAALTDLAQVRLLKVFEFRLPLYALDAAQGDRVRLRFSLWRDRLPIDALPVEGWIELQLLPEEELEAAAY
ncbi:MAG TPA: glycoside hydrolase family 57 protein [Terriglobales bacterium]|nr:glycoside hydrolase family 57 protein [Terriglobales bacterium]